MTKRNYKVFVDINVAGTVTVDARDTDDAIDVVEGMDGSEVLDDMIRDEITINADDAEENFNEDN